MKLDFLDSFWWLWFWSISLYIVSFFGCEADVQRCYIESLSLLSLESKVAAFNDRASHISGCSVSYDPSTSVVAYVLSLTSTGFNATSDKQSIVLNIDQTPISSLLSTTKVVFVLSSANPVSWDVRMSTSLTLPRILVSRPSTVNSLAKVDQEVVDDLPVDQDDLLQWVRKKYPVAKFAQVSQANHINVWLKEETHVNNNSTCVVSNNWKQNEVSAMFVEEKQIEGCILPQNSQQLAKEVYIIEHNQAVEDSSKHTVTVNLQTVTQDTCEHDVVLVLKSNDPSILWDVHGALIKGNLQIKSNGKVNEEKTFDSVSTMGTPLDHSGEDLVRSLENQYQGVVQYLFIDTANRVEITLEAPDVPRPPPFLSEDSSHIVQGNNLLEHIIHTQCDKTSMTVAISLRMLTKNSLSLNDIHLRDSSCNATTNDTHLIFKADLGKCGMELKHSQKESVYVNEVFFNPGLKEKVGGIAVEDVGSGFLPDDEDASDRRRSSESEVQCSYPIIGISDDNEQKGPITFHVCSGQKCPKKALQFSVSTVYDDPNILATIRSCVVSSLDDTVVDHIIIENGCATPDNIVISRNVNETVRINSLPISDTVTLCEVTCEVALCSPVKTVKHSQCPNRNTDMPCILQGHVESEFGTTYTIHLQPGLLPGKESSKKPATYVDSYAEEIKAVTHSTSIVVINGLTTIQVVGIAFAAFLMGIFFLAAIWYIHMHTTAIPRRNQEQSSSSQPPPYQPTSNGYAGYSQVPNGHTSNGFAGNNGHMNGFGPTINPNGIPMNGMMNSADLAMV